MSPSCPNAQRIGDRGRHRGSDLLRSLVLGIHGEAHGDRICHGIPGAKRGHWISRTGRFVHRLRHPRFRGHGGRLPQQGGRRTVNSARPREYWLRLPALRTAIRQGNACLPELQPRDQVVNSGGNSNRLVQFTFRGEGFGAFTPSRLCSVKVLCQS